jgi:hypothetical protein
MSTCKLLYILEVGRVAHPPQFYYKWYDVSKGNHHKVACRCRLAMCMFPCIAAMNKGNEHVMCIIIYNIYIHHILFILLYTWCYIILPILLLHYIYAIYIHIYIHVIYIHVIYIYYISYYTHGMHIPWQNLETVQVPAVPAVPPPLADAWRGPVNVMDIYRLYSSYMGEYMSYIYIWV